MGNPYLRAEGEKIQMTQYEVEEYIRCREDILHFAENYYYIQTIDDGRIKIPLWDFQKKMLKVFQDPAPKRHIVVLSARQMSKTTVTSLYLLHRALFSKEQNIAILANNERTSREILERIKMAYLNLPLWLQKGISNEGGWNKSTLMLENGVKIIAASTSSNSIRGMTINELLIDECSFIADYIWDDFFNSVLPTISGGKKSKIIMVSTPKGMNHFYKIYRDAVQDPESNFRAIKIPWWERPDRDDEWKKRTLADMGQDLQKFQQEYGCQFLGSSTTLIDPEVLERTMCRQPTEIKYGGALRIFEVPKPGEFYILGVDSAKGNGSDYSTIQVLKIESEHSIVQVAVYRNNFIGPDEFAQLSIGISDYYNKAFMMVESNDIGELVVNKIWYDYECDRILNCDKNGLGIRATRKSKLAGNLLLKRYMENGWLEIVDDKTLYELSRYEEVSPNVFHAAGQNEHDDTVTSLIWALYYMTTVYYDRDDNSMSDVKRIDPKYKFESEDIPVFIGDSDNEYGSGTWEMY